MALKPKDSDTIKLGIKFCKRSLRKGCLSSGHSTGELLLMVFPIYGYSW
jgi:hypothetical protein